MAKAMSGQGVTGREAELDGAKRDNEGAEQGGDGAVAEHVGGGAEAVHRVPTHWGHPLVLEGFRKSDADQPPTALLPAALILKAHCAAAGSDPSYSSPRPLLSVSSRRSLSGSAPI